MEAILIAVIAGQTVVTAYTVHMSHKERKSLLNAVMAKSTSEFVMLEKAPKKLRSRVPEPLQADAGIPIGL